MTPSTRPLFQVPAVLRSLGLLWASLALALPGLAVAQADPPPPPGGTPPVVPGVRPGPFPGGGRPGMPPGVTHGANGVGPRFNVPKKTPPAVTPTPPDLP